VSLGTSRDYDNYDDDDDDDDDIMKLLTMN